MREAMNLPLDTTADAHDVQRNVYRRLGGAERVAILFRLSGLVRETAMAGIRRRHPSYDEAQVSRALRRLILGDEMMRQVFPDQDLVDP
jgi:hypothetical protein